MFALPGFFTLDPYASERPMVLPAVSYTNETNTAQSVPLSNRVDYTRAGISSKLDQTVAKPAITPQRPAAPDPKTPQEVTNQKAGKSPIFWVGLAAAAFGLFYVVRHA
jgi:hypothetical protein